MDFKLKSIIASHILIIIIIIKCPLPCYHWFLPVKPKIMSGFQHVGELVFLLNPNFSQHSSTLIPVLKCEWIRFLVIRLYFCFLLLQWHWIFLPSKFKLSLRHYAILSAWHQRVSLSDFLSLWCKFTWGSEYLVFPTLISHIWYNSAVLFH